MGKEVLRNANFFGLVCEAVEDRNLTDREFREVIRLFINAMPPKKERLAWYQSRAHKYLISASRSLGLDPEIETPVPDDPRIPSSKREQQ